MLDLKGPLDVLNAADAAYRKQAAEIADLLAQGTDEATQNALALQPKLDQLQADYEAKLAMYNSLVKANQPSDVSKLFVPTPTTLESADKANQGVMTLAEFNALNPRDRLAFVNRDGKIEDEED